MTQSSPLASYLLNFDYTRQMLLFSLLMARTMPMIMLTPFLGGQLVPNEIKMGLGVVLCSLIYPLADVAATESGTLPLTALPYLFLMFKEVFVGFCIGQVNALVFTSVETAGRMIDTARGTAMAETNDPHTHHRNTNVGELYGQLLLVFFIAIGGHHIFLEAYFFSFAEIPITGVIDIQMGMKPFVDFISRMSSDVLLVAAVLAAPSIAATFITDVVFGILNRVAPQLNAYFMAMPVKAMGGLILVMLTLTPLLERLAYFVQWSLRSVAHTIQLLGAG